MSSRRERRAWGRRELKRAVKTKSRAFYDLYGKGLSKGAIAATLHLSRAEIDELFSVMNEAGKGRDEDQGAA